MRAVLFFCASLFTFAISFPANLCAQSHTNSTEQVSFQEDQDFERPVPLPKPILDILTKGDRVADCLKYDDSAKMPDPSWFDAAVVTLGKDGSTGYVVKGKKLCLGAADGSWYWVFRRTGPGYEMAISDAGNELALLSSYTGGYRDISVYRATAAEQVTTTYKFNGTAYRAVSKKSEPTR